VKFSANRVRESVLFLSEGLPAGRSHAFGRFEVKWFALNVHALISGRAARPLEVAELQIGGRLLVHFLKSLQVFHTAVGELLALL